MGNMQRISSLLLVNVEDSGGDKIFGFDGAKVILSLCEEPDLAYEVINLMANNDETWKDKVDIKIGLDVPNFGLRYFIPDLPDAATKFLEECKNKDGFFAWLNNQKSIKVLNERLEDLNRQSARLEKSDFISSQDESVERLYDEDLDEYGDHAIMISKNITASIANGKNNGMDQIKNIKDKEQRSLAIFEWSRKNIRPFAWDTTRDYWGGLSSEDVMNVWNSLIEGENFNENDPALANQFRQAVHKFMIDDILEQGHGINDHEKIVDPDKVDRIVQNWFLKKANPVLAETELMNSLQEWSNEQIIFSYIPQYYHIVGLFDDVTYEECVAYINNEIDIVKSKISELMQQ